MNIQLRRSLVASVVALGFLARPAFAEKPLSYPDTRKVEVTDVYHGTEVADPYRWLEDQYADEVADWVEAENEVTFAYLEQMPSRESYRERLTELWDYAKTTPPRIVAGRYFFQQNDGLQNQYVLFVQDGPDGEPRVLLDPNTLSDDGTVALGSTSVSDDGKLLAYSLSESGSDWRSWHVRDVDTGEDLPDVLHNSKFSDASWLADGSGFFYCGYDQVTEDTKLMDSNVAMKVMLHRIGEPQSEDRLVYEAPGHPDWLFGASVTDDGDYLIIPVREGSSSNDRVFYQDLRAADGETVELLAENDARYDFVDNVGTTFYFQTDLDAARGRVVAIDVADPARENWTTVIGESEDALSGVDLIADRFVATYMHDAHETIRVFDREGAFLREIELPTMGRVRGVSGRRDDSEFFFSFTSFLVPSEVWHYDFASNEVTRFWTPDIDFDFGDYAVEQVFYASKDGTQVPMYVVYKKGLRRDGTNPTLLYGYGGFNVPMLPAFRVTVLPWLERGGVYALANIRGGGEYGEEWHRGGMLDQKQNVFDDFIAAGEWLVDNEFTSPEHLGCSGGSNGGTLVGAVINQRPDLFGAALPAVGVMDMLRFHKFTIGWAWVSDYGSSDDPDQFRTLLAYSPYHNLKPQEYPAVLVTTADHDDRVVPGHSFKYAARLQEVQQGDAPVLIRIESKAGHGAGKPTSMWIAEAADAFSFLSWNLGMDAEPGL